MKPYPNQAHRVWDPTEHPWYHSSKLRGNGSSAGGGDGAEQLSARPGWRSKHQHCGTTHCRLLQDTDWGEHEADNKPHRQSLKIYLLLPSQEPG